jgi:Flp pilus assembly protein TadG
MFSFILVGVVGVSALAIDGSRMMSTQAKFQDIADAAALAGAYAAEQSKTDRVKVVQDAIDVHLAMLGDSVTSGEPQIIFDDSSETLTVSIPGRVNLFFANAVGVMNDNISADTTTSYAIDEVNPVSIAFVLDSSGSMSATTSDGRRKIDVLKEATNVLFSAIEESAPRKNVLRNKVRTGMTVYNSEMLPEYTVQMNYGWDQTTAMVATLPAAGGTNSTLAFESGMNLLLNDPIQPADLKQFIIFMTDGSNNDTTESDNTQALCQQAKEAGIRVYSVAFEAPEAGEALLLQCASPNDSESVSESGNFDYDLAEESVDKKCDRDIDNNGNGNENSKKNCERDKSKNYFDADNAQQFRAAFKQIGAEIGRLETRIVN